MRRAKVVLALLLAAAAPVHAQSGDTFQARVDRTRLALGESLTVEVTLSVEEPRVTGYRPPSFRGFRLLAERPSRSTQIQMGGGATIMRTVFGWQYDLEPQEAGNFTIGAARVRVGGRELKTSEIAVSVVAGSPGGARRPGGSGPAPLNVFPFSSQPPSGGGENFLRVQPSKTKVYVGEPILVEWWLYLTERQDKYQTVTEPRTEGFWAEDLAIPGVQRGLQLTQQEHDGRTYLVAPLLRRALFPLRPGRLSITSMESEISQVDFFGSTLRTERLKTEPVTVEVMPLPTAGQPSRFDPSAVGRFTLTTRVDRSRVAVGDAVTFIATVAGEGNLRQLPVPRIESLAGWKVYEPKVAVTLEPGDKVVGAKTSEQLLLPERPGTTSLPALALAFFDPGARAYLTAKSEPLTVEVVGEGAVGATGTARASGPSSSPAVGPSGGENVVGLDVRPPRARARFRRDLGTTFYRSRLFFGVLAGLPMAFGFTVLAGRVRERLSQETEGARRRKLRRLVRRHLRAAEAHLDSGYATPFYIEIDRVLRGLLAGKLGGPVAGLSRNELRAALLGAGVSPELAERFLTELEACDRARFAPGGLNTEEMRAALDRAGEIILQLERAKLRPGEAS